jgi:hypothetical protein
MDTASIRGGSELRSAASICLSHCPPAETTDTMGGRSNIYTDGAIAHALCEGRGIPTEAAKILKCSRQTICDALGRSPMLREIIWECEGLIFDIAYQTRRHLVQIGDLKASIFMVRRLWPKFGRSNAGDELKSADLIPIKIKRVGEDDVSGKPKVYTDETIAHALWEGYGIVSEAAKILKCSRRMICNSLERSPVLRKIMSECEGQIFDIAYENLCHHVEMGNLTAAIFIYRLLKPEVAETNRRAADVGQINNKERRPVRDHWRGASAGRSSVSGLEPSKSR